MIPIQDTVLYRPNLTLTKFHFYYLNNKTIQYCKPNETVYEHYKLNLRFQLSFMWPHFTEKNKPVDVYLSKW